MGLDLYARVEPYLEFDDAVKQLHRQFLEIVFTRNVNNIIDIGCGQGAFLNHLSANGVKNYGIDLSSEQIKVCQSMHLNAQCKPLEKVHEQFDCATAIFDVINYIDKEEIETFFKQAYGVLNKEGYFVFDINSYFGFDEIAQGSINIDIEDKFIAIDAYFEDNQLTTHITLFEENANALYTKEQDAIVQYYHETAALKEVLKKVGFAVEEIMNFNLHSEDVADKLIFICKK